MTATTSLRRLNRTLLRRQLLDRRADLAPDAAVGRLLAVQAQEPNWVHAALWSQVRGLDGVPHAPHITPHMTLCYSRQAVPEQPVPPLEWTVRRFVLLHNLRGSPGPYEVLGEWPLAD